MMLRTVFVVAGLISAAIAPAEAAYKARVVVPAGPFHGVHGLAFGPDGALYAGDILGSTVHRVDVATGAHRPFIKPPFGMADDVAFAPVGTPSAGTLVWTAVGVGKLYAQAPGGEPRVIANQMPNVNTVGFAPDGLLYFTQTGRENSALWQVDLTSKAPPKKLWDNAGGLNGFVIPGDGFLYGPQADLGTIIRVNLKTMEVTKIADGFVWPTAVEMDARGFLYVLDFNAGTITQLNKDTAEKTLIATIEPGLDNMAMGPNNTPFADKLYVSSIGRNGIFEIDLKTKAMRSVVEGQLTAPGGVTVLGEGDAQRVYVADMFSLRAVNPTTGKVSNLIPVNGLGAYPTSVEHGTLAGRDVLLMASWFTGVVQFIDPATGSIPREEKNFAAPHGMVLLDDGALIVAEAGQKKLTRVDADGKRDVIAEGFQAPVGLARAGTTLYVTDAGAGTVVAVDMTAGTQRIIASGLNQPEGIALLTDGTLAVVEVGASAVRALNPATGKLGDIVTRLDVGLSASEPLPKTWVFNGIAAAPDGSIYVPSDMQASLYVLKPSGGPTSFRDALLRLTSGWFR